MTSAAELKVFYNVIQTTLNMMRDRDYTLLSEDLNILSMNQEQFLQKYTTVDIYTYFTKTYEHQNPLRRECFVYFQNPNFVTGTGVNKSNIETFVGILKRLQTENDMIYDIIFITKQNVISPAMKEFNNAIQTYKSLFTFRQLEYNPTKHSSNSRFQLLSDSEKVEFLKNNMIIDDTKIPYIYHNDRIVLHYGARIGNIFRLTRKNIYFNSSLKETVSYRLVVQNFGAKNKDYANADEIIADEAEDTGNYDEEAQAPVDIEDDD